MASMSATHIALLRGINVGGKNRLPMKDLIGMFADAGCLRVRSYIQSGNVLVDAPPDLAERLPGLVETQIAERFGFRTTVVLRTTEQLRQAVLGNPFLAAGAGEEALHVLFLNGWPDPRAVAGLDPNRSSPDTFIVQGQEVYVHLPRGMAHTKLTNAYFDAKLTTTSTARNWRTVRKLLELAEVCPHRPER